MGSIPIAGIFSLDCLNKEVGRIQREGDHDFLCVIRNKGSGATTV